jgi:hypothetical protein
MLIPYYIKASDEQALWSALESAGLYKKVYSEFDEEGNGVGEFTWVKTDGYDLDIIGVIYKPTGETGEDENGEYEIVGPLDGYHANIRKWDGDFTEEQLAALPLIVPPNKPVRIWAGD